MTRWKSTAYVSKCSFILCQTGL